MRAKGRGHTTDDCVGLGQPAQVGGRLKLFGAGQLTDEIVAEMLDVILSAAQAGNLFFVHVESDGGKSATVKRRNQGQPDVTEADHPNAAPCDPRSFSRASSRSPVRSKNTAIAQSDSRSAGAAAFAGVSSRYRAVIVRCDNVPPNASRLIASHNAQMRRVFRVHQPAGEAPRCPSSDPAHW